MNDVERRLRDLGERAKDEAGRLVPGRGHLRRIRRRRLLVSTSAFACAATVVAAGAFAWAARTPDAHRVPPADGSPSVEEQIPCLEVPFVPTWVPERFDERANLGRNKTRPGVVQSFHGRGPDAIEVVVPPGETVQFRPEWIQVLGGRASLGRTTEGWSVELNVEECTFVLDGYGVSKAELERFATGLVDRREAPGELALVWPEDTEEAAEDACEAASGREREAPQVVSRFASEVLGWESPIYAAPEKASGPWTVRPSAPDTYGGDVSPGVRIWTVQVAPDCASITSVSRLPDRGPTGIGVSVTGDVVEIGYEPFGATSASIEVGYGGRARAVFDRRNLGTVKIHLGERRDATGHVLVLLRDHDGYVFTAYGLSLPNGDLAAG